MPTKKSHYPLVAYTELGSPAKKLINYVKYNYLSQFAKHILQCKVFQFGNHIVLFYPMFTW